MSLFYLDIKRKIIYWILFEGDDFMKVQINKDKKDTLKWLLNRVFMTNAECELVFTNEGLSITSRGATITFCYFKLKPTFFDSYQLVGEQEKFGIFVSDLVQSIKSSKGDITIENIENKLQTSHGKNKYQIPLLTDVDAPQEVPNIELVFSQKIDLAVLKSSISNALGFDKEFACGEFKYEDGSIVMEVSSTLKNITQEIVKTEKEFVGSTTIGLKLLSEVSEPGFFDVDLWLEDGKPLKITYSDDDIDFLYLIAPRV
jgi:hypothetical protein